MDSHDNDLNQLSSTLSTTKNDLAEVNRTVISNAVRVRMLLVSVETLSKNVTRKIRPSTTVKKDDRRGAEFITTVIRLSFTHELLKVGVMIFFILTLGLN